ncbi:DNA repair protein XRCC2 [Venturia canescens]|uniref:DNA repair protein XRCC2 n=1 Tax=Venturia canescens TaxID=32260 RepID=UPI001C9C22B2|nr:DNA repair protein XRCC2 [Venturia canescens]
MDEPEKTTKARIQEESGWEFLARIRKRPLVEKLDSRLFNDGPHVQETIEITGKLSSGKTLLLMQLVAKCILPSVYDGIQIEGRGIAVLLINTDHHFRVTKLVQLMHCIVAKACKNQEILCSGTTIRELLIIPCLKNLTIVNCYDNNQFKVTLAILDDILMNNPQIGLLAVDSISSFYWQDRDIGGVWLINQYLRNVLKILQQTIFQYNIVLIYTRPDDFSSKTNDAIEIAEEPSIEKINYRIDLGNGSFGEIATPEKKLEVTFKIGADGLKWISEKLII